MTESEKTQIRKVLEAARQRLQRTSQNALAYSMNHERNIGRDSIDESMEEELFSTEMRLHDREKFLLGKIVKQLGRLEKGDLDVCEDCGETIAFRRLLARPVTTLCIDCKEQSEREEAAIAQAGRGGGFDAEDTSTTATTTGGGGDSDDFGGPERGFSGVGAIDD